jgi:hypothetical protein
MVLRFCLSSILFMLGAWINLGGPVPAAIATLEKPSKVIHAPNPSPAATPRLTTGTYLYGEQMERERLNTTYLLLAVEEGKLSGVVYQLNSDYNCFTATAHPDHLALNMVDHHSGESFIYSIARSQTSVLASTQPSLERQLNLVGFHPIETVQESDRALLASCQSPD